MIDSRSCLPKLLAASLDEHTPLHRRLPTNQLAASLRDVLVRCFLPRHTIRSDVISMPAGFRRHLVGKTYVDVGWLAAWRSG